ncbi:hypothetical protein TRIUR3_16325 [Triticum urartu]|uniref:Uncharacterized protein n=1 Tax=Triticum urartu TaxID=4572 RepID=M7Z5J5_TRIUA|nr:hypothetical protein TRIUR3_16325 [Triticum urartu]
MGSVGNNTYSLGAIVAHRLHINKSKAALLDEAAQTDITRGPAEGPMSDYDDGELEEMLSELGGSLGAEAPSLAAVLPLEYWEEVPPVMGSDMGGWYVDGEGFVAGYEFREPSYYTYGEVSAVEQVYSPLCLWE